MQNSSQCNQSDDCTYTSQYGCKLSVGKSDAYTGLVYSVQGESVSAEKKIEDSDIYKKGFQDAMTIQNRKIAMLKKELREVKDTIKSYFDISIKLNHDEERMVQPATIRKDKERLSQVTNDLWKIIKK